MLAKKSMPMTALVVVLLISLATMAVGYGLWSETLYINGTVNTGEVNAELSIQEVDQGDFPFFNQNDRSDDYEVEGKDIANCAVGLSADKKTLDITITKGYPSFWCWVEFDVHNTGTIPIKVHQPKVLGAPPQTEVSTRFQWCYHFPFSPPPPPPVDEHPQLERSERVYCVLGFHVEQGAKENATYEFAAIVGAHQWNEEPLPPWP